MKVVMSVGYTDYVVDMKDAVALQEIMNRAERYESRFDREADTTVYHVWKDESESMRPVSIKLVPDSLYKMAKLAGKPLTT